MYKKIIKGIALSLLTLLGGYLMIAGELDDSPGLGGIGLILIISSTYFNIKNSK
jgi:hypothetical protein